MLSKKRPHLPKADGPDRHFDWRPTRSPARSVEESPGAAYTS